ncbi:MAG: ATP-binding protein [Nitrososphaerota archaeon]
MYNRTTIYKRLAYLKASAMAQFVRRSLLVQLLGVYLVFVLIVIGSGVEVDAVGRRQIRAQIRANDLVLAQEVAFDTYTTISGVETSLVQFDWAVASSVRDPGNMSNMFAAFKTARSDIGRVYWLDAQGILRVSVPSNPHTMGASYAISPLFHDARISDGPVVEGGAVDPTTSQDVVTVADAVHGSRGEFLGVLATTILIDNLSTPLQTIIAAQTLQGEHVLITMVDDQGRVIASSFENQFLRPEAATLPGATDALAGSTATYEVRGPNNADWLYSAVPVPAVRWAVVVRRPASDIVAATSSFSIWLLLASGLFVLGGLLFWLVLVRRVVRPLHTLAAQHVQLPPPGHTHIQPLPGIGERSDEIGELTRSLHGLKREVVMQLAELHTLLETSNAVVNSLDPRAVATTIIREVRRLVDVQAAAVLVPDEDGVLRALASEGRAQNYEAEVQVHPDDLQIPSARALHDRRPVQMTDIDNPAFPVFSAREGFRSVLAIPIISQRVGGLVLAVHRREPLTFTANEVDLLLTFANHAALAWEHAVLYERSDERLHEIAQENKRLYHEAAAEKQTLAAIIGSMSDGLLVMDAGGVVLYANPGAHALIGVSEDTLRNTHISTVHQALAALAEHPEDYYHNLEQAEAGNINGWLLETHHSDVARAIHLRLFDVSSETDEAIGRGLLLRDVTREREVDQFKSTLLAAVGHELRTPLAAIKGHASTLLQDDVTWPQDDQRHFLRTISTEADRLAQLVTNLLDLSRLEAGLLLLHRAPRRFDEIVANAARRFHLMGAVISATLPDDLPLVEVDAPRTEVVIANLIANALAYGDGLVRITAAVDGAMLRVSVADNGPGIGADDLPHIFERFYRAQRTERQSGGTGLGLAICRAFVAAHGGTIEADSSSEGTCISFTLPVMPVTPTGDPATSDGEGTPATHDFIERGSGTGPV